MCPTEHRLSITIRTSSVRAVQFKCPSFSLSGTLGSVSPPPESLGIPPPGTSVSPQCLFVCAGHFSAFHSLSSTLFRCQLLAEVTAAPSQTRLPLIFFGPLSLLSVAIFSSHHTCQFLFHVSLFPLDFPQNYLFPPSTPRCNWRIFVLIKFGRQKHNEKGCLGKNSLVQHIVVLL